MTYEELEGTKFTSGSETVYTITRVAGTHVYVSVTGMYTLGGDVHYFADQVFDYFRRGEWVPVTKQPEKQPALRVGSVIKHYLVEWDYRMRVKSISCENVLLEFVGSGYEDALFTLDMVNKFLNKPNTWYISGYDGPEAPETGCGDQVGGTHYGKGTDVFDFSLEREHDCLQHSAIKYIDRHKLKNGEEDIRKAISVLERIIQEQYND